MNLERMSKNDVLQAHNPSTCEVERVFDKKKRYKSPSSNQIPTQLFQARRRANVLKSINLLILPK
jgi:hypothetical protein